MANDSWISITKTFSVECGLCDGEIDEQRTYAAARRVAQEHRAQQHPRQGVTIGGTWGQNVNGPNR